MGSGIVVEGDSWIKESAAARISSRQEMDPVLALNSFKNFLGLVGTGHAQDLLDHTAET